MNIKTSRFDAAEYLESKEDIKNYIDEALKTDNAGFISACLGDIARAKGMTDLAKETGLSRETLYRTLSEQGNPNLKTLIAVCSSLGFKVRIEQAAQC